MSSSGSWLCCRWWWRRFEKD